MIARLLNAQGIAGLVASIALAVLLVIQKVETRHWRSRADQVEQLYRREQAAFAATIANYKLAAGAARAADRAASNRVRREQQDISERTKNDLESRIAGARARARRLRDEDAIAPADHGDRGAAPMPRIPAASGGPADAAPQDGLSLADRLTATEQAIQLDELIRWVRRQARVNPNEQPSTSH